MSSVRARLLAGARWVGGCRAVMPLTARVICARLVRESIRFLLNELRRARGPRTYHLRESGLTVVLRHASGDSATLAEIFHRRDYDLPPAVADALGQPRSVLDLGANIGLFGLHAAALWPEASIVAYEPDPDNAAVHALAIAANALEARWTLIAAAAGTADGEVALAAGLAMASHVVARGEAGEGTVPVPIRDVLAEVAAADLVKLDVEGGEWDILLDPRFEREPPRAIALEYHPEHSRGPDPRATAEEALRAAGLQVAPIWHRDDGYGMLWGWRAGDAAR